MKLCKICIFCFIWTDSLCCLLPVQREI